MKKYVIILSKKFPAFHPKKGQETDFERKFLNKEKIHTIRGNYPIWEKRIKEVQEGRAVLSIRKWTGTPYRSKQQELRQLTASDGVGVQKAVLSRIEWEENGKPKFAYKATVNGKDWDLEDVARSDGFSGFVDFIDWFDPELDKMSPDEEGSRNLELAVIFFIGFRYNIR